MRDARLWRGLALAILVGGWGVAAGPAAPAGGARGAEAQHVQEARELVSLEPRQREVVLAEMRQMLGSVNGVLTGLAAGDLGVVEKAARASGLAKAVDPGLEQNLPRAFLEMGMATHRRFDQLADHAGAGAPRDELIRSLADLTGHCVACHALYRF